MDPDEQILAAAARYLVENGDDEAASYLVLCEGLDCNYPESAYPGEAESVQSVTLNGPAVLVNVFKHPDHWGRREDHTGFNYDAFVEGSIPHRIEMALLAALGLDWISLPIKVRMSVGAIDENWRTELQEEIRGKKITNQGVEIQGRKPLHWNNLRFRSQSEIRVAEALERAEVMFMPNCLGRLTGEKGRKNQEADFLVCYNGKWGIIEVDGEPFHPPSRTTQDHQRDRLFKRHGVKVVEHFDAGECFENANGVVRRFLEILEKS